MIYHERLLKILRNQHISEKTNIKLKQRGVVVFKVAQYATKTDIKNAICMLFSVKVDHINTMIVSGKKKGSVNKIGRRSNWKKAYIILKQGYNIDSISTIE